MKRRFLYLLLISAFLLSLLSLFAFSAPAEQDSSPALLDSTPPKRAFWSGSFTGGSWTLDTYTGKMVINSSGSLSFYSAASTPWRGQLEYIKDVTIEGSCTSIGNYCFASCPNLSSIQIPDTVTSIGNYAFQGCSSLTSLEIPEGITSIGEYAFRDCSALQSISLPASLTSISGSAFFGCSSLTSIEIAQGNTAFSSANGFLYNADGSTLYLCPPGLSGTYTVPETVTYLDGPILANCPNATTIVLHDNLTWSDDAFTGATGLVNIIVNDTNPLYKTIDGVLFSKDGSTLLQYPTSRSGHYDIPEGTSVIGSYAFANIANPLTVGLPTSLTAISDYAFRDATGLTGFTANTGLTSIGSEVFSGCTGLLTVTLPNTLTSLGSYAFYACSALETITIPESIKELKEYSFYRCSSLKEISFHSSLRTLGNYCFQGCSSLESLTIPSTLTSVGWSCFYGCSGLESVTIETGPSSLGYAMFEHCTSLKQVSLPDSLTSLSSYTFASCSSLESIQLPQTLTSLGNYAFQGCSSLRDIVIPEGVKTIPTAAFSGCSALSSVSLPSSLQSIGSSGFDNCALQSVALPATLSSLGNYAFRNCPLAEIDLPSGLKTIGQYALSNTQLSLLFIPKTVTSIGNYAFSKNANLKNVHFLGDAPTVSANSFQDCGADFCIRYLSETANWTEPQWNGYNCAPWTVTIQSTADCENAGIDTIICKLCNASCALPAPAYGHNFGPWVLASRPTTELEGVWERTCARCEGKETERIPKVLPTEQSPFLTSNQNLQDYTSYAASPMTSFLTENPDGSLSRVEYSGGILMVEQYDKDLRYLSSQKLIVELPLFGGFYSGKTYNFLLFGQTNLSEDDSVEVMRVVRYSKDWLRMGHSSLYGANTSTPFRAGCPRMAEYGDMLYVHASHEMYRSDDGLRHQSNMTFSIYVPEMEITDSRYLVAYSGTSYVSHSFNQFIQIDGNQIITLDHGDAYPRSMVLAKFANPAGNLTFTGSGSCVTSNVLKIAGATGANATGASIGGLQVSDSCYLTAGNSIVQDGTVSTYGQRNIFVTATPKGEIGGNTTTFRWVTDYNGDTKVAVSTPHLVKINDTSFLLLWTAQSKLYYVFLNGQGQSVSEVYCAPGYSLSNCAPIVYNGQVLWYVTGNSKPVFLAIDPKSPEKPVLYNGEITITFNAKGYDIDGSSFTRRVGEAFGELPELVSQKSALTFTGWRATNASGTTVSGLENVTSDSVVSVFHDIILTPQWSRASHSCSYSIILNTIPATCLSGRRELRECSQCYNTQTWTWSGKGPHTEVADPYVAPTCITTGLTEGKHCSLCSEVLKAQEIISATGHSYAEDTCCDCGKIRDLSAYVKASTLSPGDYILFVWETGGMELSSFQISGTPVGLGTAYSPNSFSCAASFEVQLGYTEDTFSFKVGEKYLSWNGEDSLSLSTVVDENSSWAVSFDTDGNAIVTNGADSERILRWNETNSHFACYATEQSPIQIYVSAEDEAVLVSRSISLHGNIAVNFYMSLADHVAADETAYMRFTLANGEVRTVPMSQCTQAGRRGNQYYVFTCEVSAKEMTDEIKAQFFYADRHTQEYSYCVKTYADKILSLTKDEKLIKLITAMLHYGAASQIQFDYNTQDLANSGLEAVNYEGLQIPFIVNKDQGTALAHFAGASLLLKSETTLRLFFQVEEGVEQFTVTYGEQTMELQQRGGLYYVDIPNIAANKLGDDICVTIYDGAESAQVSYCPMAYCASVFANAKGQHPQSLLDVVAALYTYHVAASDYLNAR